MRWFWDHSKEDLSEELESHLGMAIADRIASGENPEEARAAALREFGNVALIEEVTRERRGYVWLENALHDARYALRQLRRSPGFTVTVLLTLAFGIGANLAVFQLLYSVILAKLPLAHPEEIVSVNAAKSPFDQSWQVSYAAYQRLRAAATDVPLMARSALNDATLQSAGNDSMETHYEFVSDNFFSGLGVQIATGRAFIPADSIAGQSEWPAVVRHDFARSNFGSAQQAIGRHILLNRVPVVIVGVADRRFADMVTGYAPDFWLPLEAQSTHLETAFDSLGPGHDVHLEKPWMNQPTIFWLSLVARVPSERRKTVATKWDQIFQPDRELMTEATADTAVKAALLRQTIQLIQADHGVGGIRKSSSRPLYLLMALSTSIFLVGCLNLANLQLARLSARTQELGIRMALGATRRRLVEQILIEDVLLVLLGGLAAFVVGRVASSILVHWASSRDWLMNIDLRPNLTVAAVGIGLMMLALGAFSILPALYFVRRNLAEAAGSRSKVCGISQTGRQRWRGNGMLAAQVSISLVLTVMSGCFAATLVHWETVNVGMDREHILSVYVDMNRTGYAQRHRDWLGLYRNIQQQMERTPGVRSAAVEMCPLLECGWNTALYVFGQSGLSNEQLHGQEDHVGPGFFATMGMPLLRGRDFTAEDNDNTQAVAILSRSYARQLFGDADPIGRRVGYEPAPNDRKFLVVGEVSDANMDGPREKAPPMVYMTINQSPFPIHTIQVRSAGDPSEISGAIRQVLHRIDPDLPITEIVPLATELSDGLGNEKLLARLATVYAGLTLLLVGIGFYGVMSSRTSRRKSEFGIRLALGATRQHIRMLIIGQTAGILLAGIIPGILLSAAAVRLTHRLLAGSIAANSAAVIGATLVLILAGMLAVIIPAWRAGMADPLEALKSE